MSKINYYVFTLPKIYSKRNIMLSLLVSAISIIEVLVFHKFLLLLFLVLTKVQQRKLHHINVFYFNCSYSSCYI